jgi:hypothetical protein
MRGTVTLALVERRFPGRGMAIDDLPAVRCSIFHEFKGQVLLE